MRKEIDLALRDATTNQDRRRINTLRLINATIRDRDIAARTAGADPMSDAEVLEILAKMIRMRLDQARTYDDGGRPDLAENERREIDIIKTLMPRQLDAGEIESVCSQAIRQIGAHGLRDMGRCMAELKARYAGKMDLGKAVEIVKAKLQ